jgi:hypothetical protein
MKRFNRVHAICAYLRDKPCMGCPSLHKDPEFGWCRRGCYALAREVVNIAKYGNPWGKRHDPKGMKKWRKRVAARVRPPVNLRVVK